MTNLTGSRKQNKILVLYKEKNRKHAYKKNNISKNKNIRFFLMSQQGSLNQRTRLLGEKVFDVTRSQTHRQSDYRGYRFMVSGFFSFNLSSRIGPTRLHVIYMEVKGSVFQSCTYLFHKLETVPHSSGPRRPRSSFQ